jgi:hypothetical protein
MAMAWSEITPRVQLEVPRCSIPLIEQAIRDAAIDLCSCAHIHTHILPAINVVAGTATYALTSNVTDTEVYAVRAAWFDDMPLAFAPLDSLASANPDWRSSESTHPTAFTHYKPDELVLWPAPSQSFTGGLEVEVALRPTLASAGVTDWIGNRFIEDLATGAKARLLMMPEVAWSNPERAFYFGQMFKAAKSRATIDSMRSFTRATLSARMRPLA